MCRLIGARGIARVTFFEFFCTNIFFEWLMIFTNLAHMWMLIHRYDNI
jgi:hypothetical protein